MQEELKALDMGRYMKKGTHGVVYPDEWNAAWWSDTEAQLWINLKAWFETWPIDRTTTTRVWTQPSNLMRAVRRPKAVPKRPDIIDNLRQLPQYFKDLLPRVIGQTMFPFWMQTKSGSMQQWKTKVGPGLLSYIQHIHEYREKLYAQAKFNTFRVHYLEFVGDLLAQKWPGWESYDNTLYTGQVASADSLTTTQANITAARSLAVKSLQQKQFDWLKRFEALMGEAGMLTVPIPLDDAIPLLPKEDKLVDDEAEEVEEGEEEEEEEEEKKTTYVWAMPVDMSEHLETLQKVSNAYLTGFQSWTNL